MANFFTQQEIEDTQFDNGSSTIGEDLKSLLSTSRQVDRELGELRGMTGLILEKIQTLESNVTSNEQQKVFPPPETTSATAQPFVSIVDDLDVKHDLSLSKSTMNQLLGATTEREVVRILLLHFYDVKVIRGYTLSGKTRTAPGNKIIEGVAEAPTKMIQPHYVKLIEAAVFLLFPVSKEVKKSDPGAYELLVKTKKTNCRSSITALIQYFKDHYDTEGKRKASSGAPKNQKKQKRRCESDLDGPV